MGKTSIEWCDESWPLANGCRRKSPGCENCYAERLVATRLSKTPKYGGLAVFKPGRGPQWTGEGRLWEPMLDMPLRLKTPSKIFVADMGDLFFEGFTDDEIAAVFGAMIMAPWHIYQVLTKREKRMRAFMVKLAGMRGEKAIDLCLDALARRSSFSLPKHTAELARAAYARHGLDHKNSPPWPLPWVWLGVSVEDQKFADERIPVLLQTPAAVRWVSYEPALGPIDFTRFFRMKLRDGSAWRECLCSEIDPADRPCVVCEAQQGLDWVVVGGESGPHARPFDLAWARRVIQQCRAAGVAVFFKQGGQHAVDTPRDAAGFPKTMPGGDVAPAERLKLTKKGGELAELPDDLHVRQFPKESPCSA